MAAAATPASQKALNALNFFSASIQTGFGPFLVVYLAQHAWTPEEVGLALSVGTLAGLIAQVPGGALVDAIHRKRLVVAGALIVTGASAALLAAWPAIAPVAIAQTLHALAASLLTPGIAALTLSLCGHHRFSQRLGSNARWASIGNAAAAAVLGASASWLSERAVFLLTAALVLPALLAVAAIHPAEDIDPREDHPALLHPAERRQRPERAWHVFFELHLHTFAVCAVLFQLADAAMLPLALNGLARRSGEAGFVVSAAIVVPQAVVALLSPGAGRAAQRWGRRPLLLAGFAALPLRALLFALQPSAVPLVLIQALDGIGATVFGIMVPLIAADLTRRTGYLNLAIGAFGLASGLGATLSTTLAGWIADRLGVPIAFLALAAAGGGAWALVFLALPETRPAKRRLTGNEALPKRQP